MTNIKIVIISPKNRTVYNFRGDLIKLLQSKGYDVIVTGPNKENIDKINELKVKFVEIPINKTGTNVIADLKYCKKLYKLIKTEKPDMVFGYTIKPVIYGSIASYFAGVKNINAIRMSVYLFEENKEELAFECMDKVFGEKPVGLSVRRFIGEALGECRNRPYLENGKWCYGVPTKKCDRNLMDRLFNVFRCIYDSESYAVYNLVEILKATRKDLSGMDFHDLMLLNTSLNGTSIGKTGLGSCFTNAMIFKKNIFPYGHINIVYSVSFSPDGKKLLTVSKDNSAIIWDAQTGLIIDEFVEDVTYVDDLEYGINAGVFSPDGSKIAITMKSGHTDIRSCKSGKVLTSFHSNYSGSAYFSVFSPDSKRVATTYENGTTTVRNAEDGTNVFVYDGRISSFGYNNSTNFAVFNRKNNSFITITQNGVVVWKMVDSDKSINSSFATSNFLESLTLWRTNDAILFSLEGQKEAIFSPDGKVIASVSYDNKVIIFEAHSGHLIKELGKHKCDIKKLRFSGDSSKLASISTDSIVKIWDINRLCKINEWSTNNSFINDLAFSFDSETLFVASNSLVEWDIIRAKELFIRKDLGKVRSIDVSSTNKIIATAHDDASVKVWNQTDGSSILCLAGHLNEIDDIVICEKYKQLIFTKIDTVNVWNYENQKMSFVITTQKPIKAVMIPSLISRFTSSNAFLA